MSFSSRPQGEAQLELSSPELLKALQEAVETHFNSTLRNHMDIFVTKQTFPGGWAHNVFHSPPEPHPDLFKGIILARTR